jgi:hypothetical protein
LKEVPNGEKSKEINQGQEEALKKISAFLFKCIKARIFCSGFFIAGTIFQGSP